jgi:hypothetical protein
MHWRSDDADRYRELPDVPHRMLGAVHETSDDRGRKLRATYATKVAECRDVDRAELLDSCVDPFVQRGDRTRNVCLEQLGAFGAQGGELRFRQRLAARVREESVDHAGHVPNVECGRRYAGRARVPFAFRQTVDELVDALPNLKQDVRDGLKNVRHSGYWAALPPLCICHS